MPAVRRAAHQPPLAPEHQLQRLAGSHDLVPGHLAVQRRHRYILGVRHRADHEPPIQPCLRVEVTAVLSREDGHQRSGDRLVCFAHHLPRDHRVRRQLDLHRLVVRHRALDLADPQDPARRCGDRQRCRREHRRASFRTDGASSSFRTSAVGIGASLASSAWGAHTHQPMALTKARAPKHASARRRSEVRTRLLGRVAMAQARTPATAGRFCSATCVLLLLHHRDGERAASPAATSAAITVIPPRRRRVRRVRHPSPSASVTFCNLRGGCRMQAGLR